MTPTIARRTASRRQITIFLLAGLVWSLAACTQAGPVDEGRASALATLTAEYSAPPATAVDIAATEVPPTAEAMVEPTLAPDAEAAASTGAPADSAGGAATAAPLSTGVTKDDIQNMLNGTPPAPKDVVDLPNRPTGAAAQEQAFRGTQVAANATAGLADVNELVGRQPALATFTPAPPSTLPGRLLYVRNGKFFTGAAVSEGGSELKLQNPQPDVWAPPEDPGRAWASDDRKTVAYFAGPDAAMWIMNADGTNNHAVSGDALPSDKFTLTAAGGQKTELRFRPGRDYTVIYTGQSSAPFVALVDNNERHIRGEGRLRVVHAALGQSTHTLAVQIGNSQGGNPMAFGRSTGEIRLPMGKLSIDVFNDKNELVLRSPQKDLGERELRTVFVWGDKTIAATAVAYSEGQPPAGSARVRIFNATGSPIDVTLGEKQSLAKTLAPGQLANYASVKTILSEDQRKDMQVAIYGLESSQEPVTWSSDGSRLAFLGAGDGQLDVYVSTVAGPAQRVSNSPIKELNPYWSPDNQTLAWVGIDESTGQHRLFWWRLGQTKVTEANLQPVNTALKGGAGGIRFVRNIGWVDNNRLFFHPSVASFSGGLWLFDTTRNTASQIYKEKTEDPHYSLPARSFAFTRKDSKGELYVLPLDGTPKLVVKTNGNSPLWSPDGKLLSWTEGEPTSPNGWRLHVMNADGSGDRVLTDFAPLLQEEPPVPGPDVKRVWLGGGKALLYSRVGRDYGRAEREGLFSRGDAGDDIENVFVVPTDGSQKPKQATDLTKVFYLRGFQEASQGTVAFSGFSYLDRSQQLWAIPPQGAKPVHVDADVRWYVWTAGASQ